MAKEFPTTQALAEFLAPMLPENQDYLLNKLDEPLLIKLLMVDGNLLTNILALLDSLDTSKKSGSLDALDTLKEKIITSQRISISSSDIINILVSDQAPALKLKAIYLLCNTESFLTIQAFSIIATIQLSLLGHVEEALSILPSVWANSINLPVYLLQLPTNEILPSLKKRKRSIYRPVKSVRSILNGTNASISVLL